MFEKLFESNGLSLDRLRSFLSFAVAGSIAKAAPRDVNRQSQISRQISELETFFGAELTERRGKELVPSAAGDRLAELIRQQLRDLEDFQHEQAKTKKAFTIGAGASILDWLVLPVIGAIRDELGQATVSLETFRSHTLVEAVKNGRVDFAIVRKNALPENAKSKPLIDLTFHLCLSRHLLKRGTPASAADDPKVWQTLPFTAGKDGGQLDVTLRQAMLEAGVDFHPVVECNSMLQARQLIESGECAGVLPSVGIHGLEAKGIVVREFAPLKNYGRHLVLHWNERQMRRRGVDGAAIKQIALVLRR
ncbi:MAG: LysR family transcriptional regulator [Verrucomicrobia bacterium]|nr:LysR family transcriptional regulator [Verrucomicrobiota bacterium]